jgi:hypothetical protein
MARLMRGALYLTAARTPYRRGGLAFPAGTPLTVAILALTVLQLRQLISDPLISILVGQDDGRFVSLPELDSASDAQLQTFIDTAPPVEIEGLETGAPAGRSDLEQELLDVRQALADVNGQLSSTQGEIVTLRQANATLAQERTDAHAAAQDVIAQHQGTLNELETAQARIVGLEADLAKAKKPATGRDKSTSADT